MKKRGAAIKVDFIGFPGSGKTAVSEGLAQELCTGKRTVRTRKFLYYVSGGTVKSRKIHRRRVDIPGFYLRKFMMRDVISRLEDSAENVRKNKALSPIVNVARYVRDEIRYSITDHKYSYIVLDTSPSHLLLPCLFSGGTLSGEDEMTGILGQAMVRVPDIVVNMTAPFDVITSRISLRSRSGDKYDSSDKDDLKVMFDEYVSTSDKLLKVYKNLHNTRIITPDNSSSIKAIVGFLSNAIISVPSVT